MDKKYCIFQNILGIIIILFVFKQTIIIIITMVIKIYKEMKEEPMDHALRICKMSNGKVRLL